MKKILVVLPALMLASCASWTEMREMVGGSSSSSPAPAAATASRGPASVASPSGSLTIENRSFDGQTTPQPTGPNLGNKEFDAQGNWLRNGTENAQRGSFDPWFGTGPENEGSLWKQDTQDNFFFSRNTKFKVGDVILVKVEQVVNDSLNTRIANILGKNAIRNVAAEEAGKAIASDVKKAGGNEAIANAVGAEAASRGLAAVGPERYVQLEEIPVRLTEFLKDGRFRVEGASRVIIKNAPYQVQLKGILREEDVQGNGTIASNQILESKLELTR